MRSAFCHLEGGGVRFLTKEYKKVQKILINYAKSIDFKGGFLL